MKDRKKSVNKLSSLPAVQNKDKGNKEKEQNKLMER